MPTAGLPLFTSTASLITKGSTPKPLIFGGATSSISRKFHEKSMSCKASSSSSSSYSVTNLDLYDLLGIESSSNQSQIKMAYRTLQKRCHPDIAGEAGHDMAIILNEAYALLSDPNSRSAYDKEQAKVAELRGYTGKPIYSVWFGSESEERAVFVDEVKCVGCLKCALSAEKTFAIESVYGRARVVAQWADPEYKIKEAIDACPVDCISVVERSNLAALEFLMSKQPRGNVRMSEGNAGGTSGTNIFVDVKKFQTRFQGAMDKASTLHSKETDLQREARMSAIQAIRSISNWLYWQSPIARATSETQILTHITQKPNEPNIKKLQDAAAARKRAGESTRTRRQRPSNYIYHEDYWIPSTHALPASTMDSSSSVAASEPSPTSEWKETKNKYYRVQENNRSSPIRWGIPIVTGATAAFKVWLQIGEGAVGGLKEHIGGSLALEIVNSSLLQVMLAGIMWYIMGTAIVGIIEGIGNRGSGVKEE